MGLDVQSVARSDIVSITNAPGNHGICIVAVEANIQGVPTDAVNWGTMARGRYVNALYNKGKFTAYDSKLFVHKLAFSEKSWFCWNSVCRHWVRETV